MPRLAKILIGMMGIIFFIAMVVFILGIRLIKKSLPKTSGTLSVAGLNSPVKIYRDTYGVPHLYAQNETDLFFAMGYVVAQDRIWQMDLNRRAALGTLSEIFGPTTLEADKYIRTLGLPKIANELAQNINSVSKQILTAYADGINAYLVQHKDRLPDEFFLLHYKPQPWKIEHSLAYQRLLAWNLEMAWRVDPVWGAIIEKVGEQKAGEITLDYPSNAAIMANSQYPRFSQLQTKINDIAHILFNLVGYGSPGSGSNSWVVAGIRTVTGKPILANDPHLAHQNPSIWYEVHLNAPGFDCYGVSLPGLPGIVIGHNQAIAWGLTSVMADGCDFFIENINPENSDQYFYQGRWYEVNKIIEEISVKDQPSVNQVVRLTRQGPIISDIHPVLKNSSKFISLKWNGSFNSDETLAFYKVNTAQNWQQFIDGLKYFSVPAQNIVYADAAGNIGCYCAGAIPIRNKGNGLIPRPGWDANFEWGYSIPFERLPHLFNPADGIIVAANNKVIDDNYPYFISNYWEPSYRAQRIKELLSRKEKFNLDDFKTIQMDQFSKHAQFLMPFILEILPKFEQSSALRSFFANSLKTWDLNLDTQSVTPTIFETFLINLFDKIFQDEMGDTLFHHFLELPNIPIRVTDNLIAKGTSEWFDNIGTPDQKETMNDVLLSALEETFNNLKTNFGELVYNWRWGNIHSITFEHVLGKNKPFNILYNIGPFPSGGSCTSVNNASFSFNNHDFHTIVGPSMRQIVDLSNRKNSLIVITTGQCGNPFSKHFKDQTQLWLNGKYHQAITDNLKICNSNFDLLVLKPNNTR